MKGQTMDKIRLGMIGLGGRGYGFLHLAMQRESCRVVAVAEPNRERAERAMHNAETQFDIHADYHELLARGDVDAVIITTADYLHHDPAVAAFNAGKHTFIDKPITTNVPDGLEVLEAARRSGRLLYMGFNMRHNATVLEMKRLIAEGAIGKPFFLTAVEFYAGGVTYMARWNRLKKYSGGLFLHKGSHDFDVLNWLNAPARPVRVMASAGVNVLNPEHLPFELKKGETAGPNCEACQVKDRCPDYRGTRVYGSGSDLKPLFNMETAQDDGYVKDACIYMSDKDTHDNAMSIVEYDDGSRAYHSEAFPTPASNRHYTILGDKGHMETDLHDRTIEIRSRWTKNRTLHEVGVVEGGHGGSDPSILGDFVRCVQRGEKPRATGVDGIWAIAVGCAAEISREEHRVVEIKELLDPENDLLTSS